MKILLQGENGTTSSLKAGVEKVVKVTIILSILPTHRALEQVWAMAALPESEFRMARSVAENTPVVVGVAAMMGTMVVRRKMRRVA